MKKPFHIRAPGDTGHRSYCGQRLVSEYGYTLLSFIALTDSFVGRHFPDFDFPRRTCKTCIAYRNKMKEAADRRS